MKDEEEIALKAACVQAAATLVAAMPNQIFEAQVRQCAGQARELFKEITGLPWTRES